VIASTHACDVLVAGSGASGFATALTALKRGLDVLMVEKDAATEPGVRVANQADLNQFVVEFGPPDASVEERGRLAEAVIERVQREDACLVAGARWKGRWVMRVSVISAATDERAGEKSAAAIISAWRTVQARKE
jgi:glycine/D-amino acid oxidase-like deaminating enzyme